MFLPSGEGGKRQPEQPGGSEWLAVLSPSPGSLGQALPGVTQALGHSCCTSCSRAAHKGWGFFRPPRPRPPNLCRSLFEGGAGCALPPSPPSRRAAWLHCNFSKAFSAGGAEKGRLQRQMKGKCWWEKEGQGLFLHAYEGRQKNPVSCTAAASSRPRQPCQGLETCSPD